MSLVELPLGTTCSALDCLGIDEGSSNEIFAIDETYTSTTLHRNELDKRMQAFEVFFDVASND